MDEQLWAKVALRQYLGKQKEFHSNYEFAVIPVSAFENNADYPFAGRCYIWETSIQGQNIVLSRPDETKKDDFLQLPQLTQSLFYTWIYLADDAITKKFSRALQEVFPKIPTWIVEDCWDNNEASKWFGKQNRSIDVFLYCLLGKEEKTTWTPRQF